LLVLRQQHPLAILLLPPIRTRLLQVLHTLLLLLL
jgi:hypothetical protein